MRRLPMIPHGFCCSNTRLVSSSASIKRRSKYELLLFTFAALPGLDMSSNGRSMYATKDTTFQPRIHVLL